jgi:deazaflavin-dependent oxidoreductase (nitroreductase family)
MDETNTEPARYVAPGWFTRHIFNPPVRWLARRGVSFKGSRELSVRGRKSGEWRTTAVNLLEIGDHRYLVAPRGETEWVRNLRVAGEGRLRVGRRVEAFQATEVADDAKVTLLREYLRRWRSEVGIFFEGVGPDASDDEIAAIAPGYPAFELSPAA